MKKKIRVNVTCFRMIQTDLIQKWNSISGSLQESGNFVIIIIIISKKLPHSWPG